MSKISIQKKQKNKIEAGLKDVVDENEIDCLKYQMRLATILKKLDTSAEKVKAIEDFKTDLKVVTNEKMFVLVEQFIDENFLELIKVSKKETKQDPLRYQTPSNCELKFVKRDRHSNQRRYQRESALSKDGMIIIKKDEPALEKPIWVRMDSPV